MSTRTACYGVMLAAVVAVTACTDGEDEPTPTIPTPSESTASPTSTVTTDAAPSTTTRTLSPEAQDEADATAALETYIQVLDAIGQGEEDVEALNEVAIGTAREDWITQFIYYREEGWTQEGEQVR